MQTTLILTIVVSQLLFSIADLLGRSFMRGEGFNLKTIFGAWFLAYVAFKVIATTGQLYVFSKIELGNTMAAFGAVSIILANLFGFLLLKEALTPTAYAGVTLAVIAFMILAVRA